MYAVVLVLNYLAACVFSLAVIRRFRSDSLRDEPIFRESVVIGSLLFSVEAWCFAEGLSRFNALGTPEPMFTLHLLSLLALVTGTVTLRDPLFHAARELRERVWDPLFLKITIGIATLIILPLTFIAIYYPPCTADSMTYHLPRILHWIQNGNVEIYPTNYPRQLYYQPFAEYLILPWELLTGGDFFDNTVQIVALVVMLMLLSLLVRFFGGNTLCQFLAVALALASPIVIFEASTTQTDLILTAFFFSFLYFGFKLSQREPVLTKPMWFLCIACMAVSLGLGLNTKLSVAAFEIPFCVWFGLRFLTLYGQKASTIFAGLVVGFLLFNIPYFHRNYEISGSIFGPAEIREKMSNRRFGVGPTFSNALRNVTMQLRVPNQSINETNKTIVTAIHDMFGMSMTDTATSYTGDGEVAYEYETIFILDDYRSGNILIIVLLGITFIAWTAKKIQKTNDSSPQIVDEASPPPPERKRKKDKGTPLSKAKRTEAESPMIPELSLNLFTGLMVIGFLIYSGLFRWQPFGARLLLPCFLGVIPYIVIMLEGLVPKTRSVLFCILLLGVSLLYTVYSAATTMFFDPTIALYRVEETLVDAEAAQGLTSTESTVGSDSVQMVDRKVILRGEELWNEYYLPRESLWEGYLFRRNYKYFRLIHRYLLSYLSVTNKIDELGSTNIGIAFDRHYDRWEYPFWPILRSKGKPYRIEWAVYPEYLKKSVNYDPDFVPELLITDWPHSVLDRYFDVGHAWKYEIDRDILGNPVHIFLVEVKGRKTTD